MSAISTEDFIKKHSHVNFKEMVKKESNPIIRERLLAFSHLIEVKVRKKAAAMVGRNPEWIRTWLLRYDKDGYQGLFNKVQPGAKSKLTKEQEEQLVVDILGLQDSRNGGRVTGEDIRELIKKNYKVEYKGTAIYDVLERIGMSWVSSRSKHPKSDENKQNGFKKTLKARLSKIKAKKKAY